MWRNTQPLRPSQAELPSQPMAASTGPRATPAFLWTPSLTFSSIPRAPSAAAPSTPALLGAASTSPPTMAAPGRRKTTASPAKNPSPGASRPRRTASLYLVVSRRKRRLRPFSVGRGALYRSTDKAEHWQRIELPAGVTRPNGPGDRPSRSPAPLPHGMGTGRRYRRPEWRRLCL